MKVSVYDTYVLKNNKSMHFDILIEENDSLDNVYKYGKEYLHSKGLVDYQLTTKECNFCHIESASMLMEQSIKEKGYFILEIENC